MARNPHKIVASLQCEIDSAVSMLLGDSAMAQRVCESILKDWRFFVTDTQRGRTRFSGRTLTVPLWAHRRGADYFLYYVAHELAHVVSYRGNHGPEFMRMFRAICPDDFQHFELGYKPRAARAAGISKKESI